MNDVRPIDANALASDIESARTMFFHSPYERRFHEDRIEFALGIVEEAPTLDYAPVRHGEWEEEGNLIWCSRCLNSPLYDYFGKIKLSSSCPHCGAKMDGWKKDD